MLESLQLMDDEVSIVLTDDDQIRNLNRSYRKKDRPTDVLAFALREGEHAAHAGPLLGDIVVSVPTARRQAAAARHDLMSELTGLIAHGLLHLLGWDHDTRAKDQAMRLETRRLVRAASSAADGPARSRPRAGAPRRVAATRAGAGVRSRPQRKDRDRA